MFDREVPNRRFLTYAAVTMLLIAAALSVPRPYVLGQAAQNGSDPTGVQPETDMNSPVPDDVEAKGPAEETKGKTGDSSTAAISKIEGINLWHLLVSGGFFMIPISLMSLLVVTFVIERFIALRRSRVLPQSLVAALGQLGGPQGGFDPRKAYRICQQFPSAASTVVRAMLLKVGRPHSEVEHSVREVSDREATRLYSNVRWLNLAAAVTPLIGLLGTVWGMIRAFHDTTQLGPEHNKAEYLASGIYIALVTTLGGLIVAIPAAICSHFFEGRIQSLFHQVDEMLFNLLPQIERFEGRIRFSRQPGAGDGDVHDSSIEAPPVQQEVSAPK